VRLIVGKVTLRDVISTALSDFQSHKPILRIFFRLAAVFAAAAA